VHRSVLKAAPGLALGGILLFLLVAAAVPPRWRADLQPMPDVAEYTIGAINLRRTGYLSVAINHVQHPIRYPYGYPLLLMPGYALFGQQPENAVLTSLLLGLAGVALAYVIGQRSMDHFTGIVACLLLALSPTYTALTAHIGSEMPSLVLAELVVFCLVMADASNSDRRRAGWLLLVGLCAGFAVSVRYTNLVLVPAIVAFIGAGQRVPVGTRLKRAGIALLGCLLAVIPLITYNWLTFGGPWRTGYEYWEPSRYADIGRAFSIR